MSFIDFLIQNYVYILVVLIILILIVIGFIVDKSGKNKKKDPKAPKNKNMDPASPELTPQAPTPAPNVSLNQGPTGANTMTSPVREVGDANTNGVNMNTAPLREVLTNETIVPRPINVTENLERPSIGAVSNPTPTVGNPNPMMGQNYGTGINVNPQNNINNSINNNVNRVNQGVNYNPSNPTPRPTIMPNNIPNNKGQIPNQMPYNNGNNIGFSAMRPQNNMNQNTNQSLSGQRIQGYPNSQNMANPSPQPVNYQNNANTINPQNQNTGMPNQTPYQQGVSPSVPNNTAPQNNTYNPLNDMGIRFVTGENNAPKTNAEDNNEWNV